MDIIPFLNLPLNLSFRVQLGIISEAGSFQVHSPHPSVPPGSHNAMPAMALEGKSITLEFLPRVLRKSLLNFQKHGVRFGIRKEGRYVEGRLLKKSVSRKIVWFVSHIEPVIFLAGTFKLSLYYASNWLFLFNVKYVNDFQLQGRSFASIVAKNVSVLNLTVETTMRLFCCCTWL